MRFSTSSQTRWRESFIGLMWTSLKHVVNLVSSQNVTPAESVTAVASDPDDNSIHECSLAARFEVIVSGSRHLLQMGAFRGVRILKAAEFLEMLERGHNRS